LAAFPIFALAAADMTRFFTTFSSRLVESPKAFAAARIPFNWCCSLDQRLSEIDNGLRARFATPLDYFWIAVIRPESMPSAEIAFYKPT